MRRRIQLDVYKEAGRWWCSASTTEDTPYDLAHDDFDTWPEAMAKAIWWARATA